MELEVDRYARQRLIAGWDQERLRNAHLLIAGMGALGNEVAKNLALLGVGHLLIIDFDLIEVSNLSRTVLFSPRDVGRSKVEVAVAALRRLNPDVQVSGIAGDLFYDVGLGYYRHSDLALGCLDNLAARSQVGLSCSLAGIPYLDGGMWSLGGEARWFFSGAGPCFDCTLSDADRERINERRSCTGFGNIYLEEAGEVPTVATTAAIMGGILAQEAVKWLCGYSITAGQALVYNGQALSLHRAALARDPHCRASHQPYPDVIELPARAAALTGQQLLARACADIAARPAAPPVSSELLIELGRDFLLSLHCPQCGHRREIRQLWGQVPESTRNCPRCGTPCDSQVLHTIGADSPYTAQPLASLGVPAGEVVAVRAADELLLYELTADVAY